MAVIGDVRWADGRTRFSRVDMSWVTLGFIPSSQRKGFPRKGFERGDAIASSRKASADPRHDSSADQGPGRAVGSLAGAVGRRRLCRLASVGFGARGQPVQRNRSDADPGHRTAFVCPKQRRQSGLPRHSDGRSCHCWIVRRPPRLPPRSRCIPGFAKSPVSQITWRRESTCDWSIERRLPWCTSSNLAPSDVRSHFFPVDAEGVLLPTE